MGVKNFAKSDVINDPYTKETLDYFDKLDQEPVPFEEFYGFKNRETGENVEFSYYMNSVDVTAGGAALLSTRLTASERKCRQGCGVDGTCSYGITLLEAGLLIPIHGIGTKYSGLYEIQKVRHTYDENGYHTSFEASCPTRCKGKQECNPCDPCCGPGYGTSKYNRVDRGGRGYNQINIPASGTVE